MEENYLITIKGTMEQRGDTDTVELMTRGSLVHKDGAYYIVYKETETTGYEGCTTTVKVAEDARKVSMLRFGKQSSQLIIEKGTRHLCHYETGYGSISLGVAAVEVLTPETLPRLLETADSALYSAKEYGRNRVHLAGELVKKSACLAAGDRL